MPSQGTVASAGDGGGGQMGELTKIGMRLLLVFMAYNIIQGFRNPESVKPTTDPTGAKVSAAGGMTGGMPQGGGGGGRAVGNLWEQGVMYDLKVYLSERLIPEAEVLSDLEPIWVEEGLTYDFSDSNYRTFAKNLTISEDFRTGNHSMWLYSFLLRSGPLNPDTQLSYSPPPEIMKNIVEWRAAKKSQGISLLEKQESVASDAAAEDGTSDQQQPAEYVRYWKPELYLQLVTDWTPLGLKRATPETEALFTRLHEGSKYLPLLYVNEFWLLKEHHVEANETVTEVPLTLHFAPISLRKFEFYNQMEKTWKNNPTGQLQDSEIEEVKRMLLDTNPYLLALTALISIAHSVLEMLAFKSDISHWRSVKSMEGVSVRSMFWKVGMETVIFLYLLDNETSWMVLIGSGVGVLIEIWKLGKAVSVKSFGEKKLLGFIPWVELEEKSSYAQTKTKEYDDQAMKYLSYVLYPLVVAYAIYSLIYEKHKSWYSWVISSLVGAVYAFGFIMMFPQIFINYKLKSVAHLPMKAFAYKALNTFIDDLFSFIIKMPMMHRLACFRDDIVFAIFLYQRWKYPVDKSRVNEFGQVFEEGETTTKKKKKSKKIKAAATAEASSSIAETSSASEVVSSSAEVTAEASIGDKKDN